MRRIAVSLGDPNGIGPEIVLKALDALRGEDRMRVTVFGAPAVLERAAAATGLQSLLPTLDVRAAGELPAPAMRWGEINAEAGVATVAAASAAIQACRAGEFDAVVAGPHHETAIAQAGIRFSGYPSLVARVCEQPEDSVFLLLVGGGLRIVHVTLHESVATALARITPQLIVDATLAGLRGCRMLGLREPRIALFGINPHASEGTLFGPEDAQHVVPAAEQLRAQGIAVTGPQGADVVLGTTGHGSAMDIAGTGQARPDALLRSLRLLAGLS